jgi:hypothetical protein
MHPNFYLNLKALYQQYKGLLGVVDAKIENGGDKQNNFM